MKPSIIFVLEHGALILWAAPKEAHFCEFTNKNQWQANEQSKFARKSLCRALLTKCNRKRRFARKNNDFFCAQENKFSLCSGTSQKRFTFLICTLTHENQRILIFRAEMKSLFHFMLRQDANTKEKEGFILAYILLEWWS